MVPLFVWWASWAAIPWGVLTWLPLLAGILLRVRDRCHRSAGVSPGEQESGEWPCRIWCWRVGSRASQCRGFGGVQGCSAVPGQAPAGLADPCQGSPWANHRGRINWTRAWLGLGKGPVKQPQPDGDTDVCRCHTTVTGRAVTTQVAVSDALNI